MTEYLDIPIVAKTVRVAVERDAAGAITGISATADDMRAAVVAAINAGLQRGRTLEELSLRTLATRDLIYGLMP